ncbi:MAG: sigma-70 family RNA polymerase sigma factor [Thermodesulfobacteriota bacterium]
MRDEDLVRQFRKGDTEAFSELAVRYSRPLTTLVQRIVGDWEDAKDITQTAFLKAYESLPRFMMASSFKTWLYRIAINAARDHLRKKSARPDPEAVDELADPGDSVTKRLDKARMEAELRKAVESLPEKQRETLLLRVDGGLDYKEIAKVLGGTPGAARGNFFQATKSLKEKLRSLR